MGYYERTTDDQIRTSFVARAVDAWHHYKSDIKNPYEVTLLLCVTQAVLTNLIEFYDHKAKYDPKCPLSNLVSDLPLQFGINSPAIKSWAVLSDEEKNKKNIRNVLEVIRHALSHPTVEGPTRQKTGYTSIHKDGEIAGFIFSCYDGKRVIELSVNNLEILIGSAKVYLKEELPVESRERVSEFLCKRNWFTCSASDLRTGY